MLLSLCGFPQKKKDDDEDGQDANQQVPRIFVTFKDAHTYQLRAYIYQARDMYGSDKSGLSGGWGGGRGLVRSLWWVGGGGGLVRSLWWVWGGGGLVRSLWWVGGGG